MEEARSENAAANSAAASKSRKALGLTLVILTALIWVVSSFISEALVSRSAQSTVHVPPFFLTYLATTLFTIYIPLFYGRAAVKRLWQRPRRYQRLNSHSPVDTRVDHDDCVKSSDANEQRVISAACWSAPLWFIGQYTFNLSLAYTSVTSNTILSSTSSLFTFGLSVLILREAYSTRKILCIAACLAGTALVTLSDSRESGGGSVLGDMLTVVSAAVYAAYTVVMKAKMRDDHGANVQLFFGYVGLLTVLVLTPIVGVMQWLGTSRLQDIPLPAVGLVLVEGLLDYVLADYLWARSVLLVGPTVATLCLSIQIPIAAGAEALRGSPAWTRSGAAMAATAAGTALILAGFFGINSGAGGGGGGSGGDTQGARAARPGRRSSSGDGRSGAGVGSGVNARGVGLLDLSESPRRDQDAESLLPH